MPDEDRSVFELEIREPTSSAKYGELPDQIIDYFLPGESKKPLLILIHGGFWRPEYDRQHISPFASKLSELGWPVASIEYRRIIGNPDATIQDVNSAIAEASKDFNNAILIGHSAGGHLALIANANSKVVGVIALAPVTDLQRAEELDLDEGAVSDFLGAPAKMRVNLDPIERAALQVKTLLIHGSLDIRVPVQFSRDYVARMASVNTQLLELPNLGHFEVIDPSAVIFEQISYELSTWN